MQHFTHLLSLDTRREKLKLYLETWKSSLVRLEPRYGNLSLQFQDVERHLDYMRPWIDAFEPNLRGLDPRGKKLRAVFQKVFIFGLILLLILPWLMFLRRGESPFANRRKESDTSVFNRTLGVCSQEARTRKF